MGQEKKFKFALTQENYNTVKNSLTDFKEKTYWSIYYDTPHENLHKLGYTYRLTLIEDGKGGFRKPKMTFKGRKHKTEHGLYVYEEVEQILECPLTKDDFFLHHTLLLPDTHKTEPWKKIEHIADGHPYLYVIGSVKVRRIKFALHHTIAELDEISYSKDIHDFELEVETEDPDYAYPYIVSFLNGHKICPTPSLHGKLYRFWSFRKQYKPDPPFTW